MKKAFNRNEVFELLKKGNKEKILEYDLSGADLSDADLSSANLRSADLFGADLRGADLSNARLNDADLRYADLSNADLRCANLRSADLFGADLRGADLSDANLRDANLDYSCLPLWGGGLKIHIDDRIGTQLLYHALSSILYSKNTSADLKKAVSPLVSVANRFDRTDEYGILQEVD